MKILVTGGAGYIGSHCSIALMEKGYDVLVLDSFVVGRQEIADALKNVEAPGKLLGVVKADLGDPRSLKNVFNANDISAVVHFAAFSQVGESMKDPVKYYRNNVVGTLNLLDAMLNANVKKIVFSSTAAVYGEPDHVPIDEEQPKRPINPYGNSKIMIETIMDDLSVAKDMRSVRLRYFNVAGADSECRVGEWHDPETHLIPNILKSTFDGGEPFKLFGNDYETRDGTCVRDYVNVEDLAEAHILALEYLFNGGKTDHFNIGTNDGNTVLEVFKECENVTEKEIPLTVEPRRPGDPAVLTADNTKAKRILKWEPRRSLRHSIETAYEWEKKMRSIRE